MKSKRTVKAKPKFLTNQDSFRQPVSPLKIREWKNNREHGDIERMAKHIGVSSQTISNAFRGTAKKEIVAGIDSFYGIKKVA